MRKKIISFFFLVLVILTVGLSVWGPEALSRYKDHALLGRIYRQEVELTGEGYRYELSAVEKLYVLSQALGSQMLSENEGHGKSDRETPYQGTGENYALIINHRGLEEGTDKTPSREPVCEDCSKGIQALKTAGILPDSVQEPDPELYDTVLYSAIDVREPRSYVSVWKVSLTDNIRGISKENRLIDIYMDADDGKIYEFYARTEWEWEQIDPDAIATAWCAYLDLPTPTPCETVNPLMEATPYFCKYIVSGESDERTIMTVGFYEGIRELFVKISW